MTFQRARRPEHKQQRYEAILAAARELALRDGVRTVSLGDIAGAVGMHKSALLRYFETREDIYLRLAAADMGDWVTAMRAALAPLAAGSVRGVASAFATTLASRPLLCDLLVHVPLNLERNVSLDAVREFKHATFAAMTDVMTAVRTVLPDLSAEGTQDLVNAVGVVAGGLWQAGHPPQVLADLYAQEPDLGHATAAFEPTISRFVETMILGIRARESNAPVR